MNSGPPKTPVALLTYAATIAATCDRNRQPVSAELIRALVVRIEEQADKIRKLEYELKVYRPKKSVGKAG